MLEVKWIDIPDNGGIYQLFADGVRVEEVSVNTDVHRFGYVINTYEESEKLVAYKFSDFPSPRYISIRYTLDWCPVINELSFTKWSEDEGGANNEQYYEISFSFSDLSVWQRPYSFKEYYDELTSYVESLNSQEITVFTLDEDDMIQLYSINFEQADIRLPIIDEIIRCSHIFHNIHREVEQILESRLREKSLVVSFDFPEEVRVPCEQYLLYFVQFLKDLGVEATAELQHEAGQVLFAVTPTDKDEALDKIRIALANYLKLAASPVNPGSVLNSEIEVQRLSANIQHLQGQLTLAHAVLQAKDATIELQQATIGQQRRFIDGEIMLESMKDVTPKPKEKDVEEVFDGLAEITKYEGKGFNLNLPEAFRRMKQLFKEKKGGKK